MDTLVALKNVCEDNFEIEFEVLPAVDPSELTNTQKREIAEKVRSIDEQLVDIQAEIDKLNINIDRLTSHADGIDYAAAVTCGIVVGIFDSVFVGEWDFKSAKAMSSQAINEKVIAFAKKDPRYKKRNNGMVPERLDTAIEFLESTYHLPGDGAYQKMTGIGISGKTHRLDDYCHHPTLIGLVSCILVQFTGDTRYVNKQGKNFHIPITINEYGNFVGKDPVTKLFSGIVNWFITVAGTIANRKGHFMSDMATKAGLPGSFLSITTELASLPCFKNKNFLIDLRKAYTSGLGPEKGQVNLGVFNCLFEGADSRMDMRTELAVKNELKRQAVPIIMNEMLVRGVYTIRRFIIEMKQKESILNINWQNILPVKNRTIVRMMTVASGTFTAIDMADASIRSAIKSGGFTNPAFFKNMILRVNFVGIGRFAIAVGTDVGMGISKSISRNKRIDLYNEQIALTNAKLYYKQANMWIEAEDAGKAIDQAYEEAEKAIVFYNKTLSEIDKDMKEIETYIPQVEEHNPGFLKELKDILEWGDIE